MSDSTTTDLLPFLERLAEIVAKQSWGSAKHDAAFKLWGEIKKLKEKNDG
jgi:hypothetical protein